MLALFQRDKEGYLGIRQAEDVVVFAFFLNFGGDVDMRLLNLCNYYFDS